MEEDYNEDMRDGINHQSISQPIRDVKFLLKRIDPSETNTAIKHNLMGEEREDGKWVRTSDPLIKDESLLGEITGMIERLVNPELRLSEFSKDEVIHLCEEFAHDLNDLLFIKGYNQIKNTIPNYKKSEGELCIDADSHLEILNTVTTYVFGNMLRAVDRREAKLITQISSYSEVSNNTPQRGGIFNFLGKKR